jgi:hypothetical protein
VQLKVAIGKYCYLFYWTKVEEDEGNEVSTSHGLENSMRTLMAVAAALLVAVAIGVWSSSSTTDATVSKATLMPSIPPVSKATALVPGISVWEIHNQAHLENLPVQEVDDQTFVFTAKR